MTILTYDNFQDEVLKKSEPVVVVFGNTWSPKTNQIFELLNANKVNFCFMDLDEYSDIAMKYSIRSSPLVHIFNHGNVIAILSPAFTVSKLLQILETGLGT